MTTRIDGRPLGAAPERHAAAQRRRVVDDEHLVAVRGVLLELVPRAAEQQRVPRPQRLLGALDGVAGRCTASTTRSPLGWPCRGRGAAR